MERTVISLARHRALVADVTDSLDSVSVPQEYLAPAVTYPVPPTPGGLTVDMSAHVRKGILMDVTQR